MVHLPEDCRRAAAANPRIDSRAATRQARGRNRDDARGEDVRLDFTGATASSWRLYRDEDRQALGDDRAAAGRDQHELRRYGRSRRHAGAAVLPCQGALDMLAGGGALSHLPGGNREPRKVC